VLTKKIVAASIGLEARKEDEMKECRCIWLSEMN